MAALTFDRVGFSYEDRPVLSGLTFSVQAGELLVVLGPSGSGKSTMLRLAAGLDAPGAGSIALNGRIASSDGRVLLQASARGIALVFQDLALWPHMTCEEQLRFTGPGVDHDEREALLHAVGLAGFEHRLPGNMSGGERQRLAMARALSAKPRILLLDEPFSNLDPGLRLELRRLLLELHRAERVTTVYVTHDLDDAFALADRVAVLNQGALEQCAPPEELYFRPETVFVATFVGRAAIVAASLEGGEIRTPFGKLTHGRPGLAASSGVAVVLRPEDVVVAEDGVSAVVQEVQFGAGRYVVRASTEWGPVWTYVGTRRVPGDRIFLRARHGWPIPSEH